MAKTIKQKSLLESMPIPDSIAKDWSIFIHEQENPDNKEYYSATKTYKEYKGPDGSKVVGDGIRTAFLPEDVRRRAEQGTFTEADHAKYKKIAMQRSYDNARKAFFNVTGKDNFSKLPKEQQLVAMDIDYTTKKGIFGFPKFLEGLAKRDTTAIINESKRYYRDEKDIVHPITKRNNATIKLLRQSFEDLDIPSSNNPLDSYANFANSSALPMPTYILDKKRQELQLKQSSPILPTTPHYPINTEGKLHFNPMIIRYDNGGKITEEDKAAIRSYLPTLENQAYFNRAKQQLANSEYGTTSEIIRDENGNIIGTNYIPAKDITEDAILAASGIGALGKQVLTKAIPKVNKAVINVGQELNRRAQNISSNIADMRAARMWNAKYDYPGLSYSKVFSTKATDRAIQEVANTHNTFMRGIHTNLSSAAKEELIKRGIDPNNIEDAVTYMSSHIPPKTTGLRAGKAHLPDDMGALYTTNSEAISNMYATNNGYVATIQRPTNFNMPRNRWLEANERPNSISEYSYGNNNEFTNFVIEGPVGSKPVDVISLQKINDVATNPLAKEGFAKATLKEPLSTYRHPLDDPNRFLTELKETVRKRDVPISIAFTNAGFTGKYLVDKYKRRKEEEE